MTLKDAHRIAREFFEAIERAVTAAEAGDPAPLPSDAWLDARLRECGCPVDELEKWRDCTRPGLDPEQLNLFRGQPFDRISACARGCSRALIAAVAAALRS